MSRKHSSSGKKSASPPLPVWPEQIVGGKHIRMLDKHLRRLRREDHANRKLFLDDVVVAYLLAFFNPTLRTLRTLEDFSQTRQAQRHLSVTRLCRSTVSDFNHIADANLLQPIVEQLLAALPAGRRSPDSHDLPERLQHVLAVDGTFFGVAADVAWAVMHRTNQGQRRASVRLDVHLDVHRWLPEIISVGGAGESEPALAKEHVRPGAIHVYDRGFFDFDLIQTHIDAGSELVLRMRQDGERCPRFLRGEARELSAADRSAGVLSDHLGQLAGSSHRIPPKAVLREVIVVSPDQPGGQIRLLTNILDLDAATLALIYRWRWQVELFFRWLKVFAHFDHLLSHSRAGVEVSLYVAVIGVLLMLARLDAKPNKYVFNMLHLVAMGAATLDEIVPILQERQRQIDVGKANAARRKAKKAQANV